MNGPSFTLPSHISARRRYGNWGLWAKVDIVILMSGVYWEMSKLPNSVPEERDYFVITMNRQAMV
jgi:hypothetical protein